MFERFTRYGRASIAQAGEEARRLNSPSVAPEHIFLGLARYDEAVAGKVLAQSGVTLEAARTAVEAIAQRGDRPVRGEVPFSPEAKKVLGLALDEAKRLRHNYIGTEHLLLALLHLGEVVDDAPVLAVMQQFGLAADRVLELIMIVLGERLSRGSDPLRLEGTRNNVVMCRVSKSDLEAIDTLVESGVRIARSDAAAWLIHAGIDANKSLFERLQATVQEIRRLREQAQAITRDVTSGGTSFEEGDPSRPPQGEAH